MKIKLLCVMLCLAFTCYLSIDTKSRLTYRYNHGRLGDVLLDFTINYYIARKNNLDLCILPETPYNYLKEFYLVDEIPILKNNKSLSNMVPISAESDIKLQLDNTLFVSQLYIPVDGISDLNMRHQHMFKLSIEEYEFGTSVRRCLTPKDTFIFAPPENIITVAIHIRKGGGFDNAIASLQYRSMQKTIDKSVKTDPLVYVDRSEPFKFPPEQYYVDQLIFLYHLLGNQPLYVYIFTDDQNPENITQNIRQQIESQGILNIQFDCRKETNRHNINIIKDIYLMSKFDYFIKSCSHFPWISQMIGNHKAIISPKNYQWFGDYLDITESEILIPNRHQQILYKVTVQEEHIETIRKLLHITLPSSNGLTFIHNGGRLGDTLLDYAKNYYIAQKYELDLYIHDGIPYIKDFNLYKKTPRLDSTYESLIVRNTTLPQGYTGQFDNLISINNDKSIDVNKEKTLFKSDFYITVDDVSDFNLFHSHMFKCSIEQPAFGKEIKERLTPQQTYDYHLPSDCSTVALHIRKGGGIDQPLASDLYRPAQLTNHKGKKTCKHNFVDRSEPLKFPSEQYYVDMLIFLHQSLQAQPLYVHLFTDDKDPQTIADRIQTKLHEASITNIIIEHVLGANRATNHIIEDIYYMSKFDYLIKSGSHYPWIAQMIGNHKAIISPLQYAWYGDYLEITQAEVVIPDRINHILHTIHTVPKNIPYFQQLLGTIAS